MTVYDLAPRHLNGFPVDIHPGNPEIGGFDVYIWKTPARHDGMLVHLADLCSVYRFFRGLAKDTGGAA